MASDIAYYSSTPLDLFISPGCANPPAQKKEENMAIQNNTKHYVFSGSASKFEKREDAEKAAKKQMEAYSRQGYGSNDIAIYEAVACITFPIPSYEVVELAPAKA